MLGGTMLATLLAALDQTIVATALPRIVGDLHGFDQLSWVVTAYLVAGTVTAPIYGRLSDIFGRRRLFAVSISIFVVASALCGIAQDMTQLVVFRALQGLGAGGLLPLAQAAIADLFSPRERGRYQAYISIVWATAAIAGPLVGGTLTDAVSWRWIFFMNIPLGALALAVVMRTIPSRYEGQRREPIDYLGGVLLASALTCVLLAAAWGGNTYAWDSAEVVGAAAAGVALLVAFVLTELRVRDPLLPLSLFRGRTFSVSSAAGLLIGAILFTITIYVPVFVQGVFGDSATQSGVILLPLLLSWVLASIVSGQIVSRTGRYRLLPIAGSALVLLGVLVLTRLGPDSPRAVAAVAMGLTGLGMGSMFQVFMVATQTAVRENQMGVSTATLLFFRSMGGSLAVAGMGAVLAARITTELESHLRAAAARIDPNQLLQGRARVPTELADGAHAALAGSLHTVFLVAVPLAALLLGLALVLPEHALRAHPVAVAEAT
jgi:EmrB/QacA subfamily drug resistance transporter